MDEKCFVGDQSAQFKHIRPDRINGFGQGRGIGKAHIFRYFERVVFMHDTVFGVATAGHQTGNACAELPARDARSAGYDRSGKFQSLNLRCTGRWRIKPHALITIAPIDTGRADFNKNLVFVGTRRIVLGK